MRPIRLIVEIGAHRHEGCRCARGELQIGGTASKWAVLGNVTYFVSELPESGSEVASRRRFRGKIVDPRQL